MNDLVGAPLRLLEGSHPLIFVAWVLKGLPPISAFLVDLWEKSLSPDRAVIFLPELEMLGI